MVLQLCISYSCMLVVKVDKSFTCVGCGVLHTAEQLWVDTGIDTHDEEADYTCSKCNSVMHVRLAPAHTSDPNTMHAQTPWIFFNREPIHLVTNRSKSSIAYQTVLWVPLAGMRLDFMNARYIIIAVYFCACGHKKINTPMPMLFNTIECIWCRVQWVRLTMSTCHRIDTHRALMRMQSQYTEQGVTSIHPNAVAYIPHPRMRSTNE